MGRVGSRQGARGLAVAYEVHSQERDVKSLSGFYPFLSELSMPGRKEVGLEDPGMSVRICDLEQINLCASISSSIKCDSTYL